jgi:hypothetical protein
VEKRHPLLVQAVRLVHVLHQLVDDAATHHVVEDGVAGESAAERRAELFGRGVADRVAAPARAQHRDHDLVIGDTGVSEHASVRRAAKDRPDRRLAPTRQVHVHERHVGMLRLGQRPRL